MTAPDPSRPSLFDLLLARWDEGREATPSGATPATVRQDEPRWSGVRRCVAALDGAALPTPGPAGSADVSFGRFVIRGELGRGGFGVVFLADDSRLGRPVALKVPRPEFLLDPERRQRFVTEARAVAALDHPNIVAVHEAGEVDGVAYLAMAYCDGSSLATWLKNRPGPVRPREAAELLAALADAMHHAHTRGVLHRDLKPGNILLAAATLEPTNARIADFGLAKRQDDAGLTQTGAVLGTPAYMAPEQAAGRQHDIGTHTDVYALGTILYELLTGRPPFSGSGSEIMVRLMNEEPVAPRRLNPRIPRDLETVCEKCLAKEPARRYSSAAELAADLRRWLAGEPIGARPVGPVERVARWGRRNPALAAALFALGMTLVVAGLVSAWGMCKYTADLQEALLVSEGHRKDAERRLADVDDAASLIQSFSADCRNGRFVEARDAAMRSIDNFRRIRTRNPDSNAGKRSLALSLEVCGACWCGLEDYRQAVAQFDDALKIYRELTAANPRSIELTQDKIRALDYLIGTYFVWRDHDDEVVNAARELIEVRRILFSSPQRDSNQTIFLFVNLLTLGDYLLMRGRTVDARHWYDEAGRFFEEGSVGKLDLVAGVSDVVRHRLELVKLARSPGFDGVTALVGYTDHNELIMRQQLDLKDRNDYVRLAAVSEILSRRQFPFRVVYLAARGFANAANLAPAGELRNRYDQKCLELIAKLYNFNNRVGERLRGDPAFARHMQLWQRQ